MAVCVEFTVRPLKHVRAPRALSPVYCALCGRPRHSSRLPSGKAPPTGAVTALTFFNRLFCTVLRAYVRVLRAGSRGGHLVRLCTATVFLRVHVVTVRDCACLAASRFLITCRVYSRISRELGRLRTCVAILRHLFARSLSAATILSQLPVACTLCGAITAVGL